MNSLERFENDLASLIGRPTDLRPLVCDGSPIACQVFIVGFNPATTMSADFWQFWRPELGFDKTTWLEAYKNSRMTRPLKAGKTRRNPVSNTRRVIEWILEEASPIRCLETNIYSAPTEQAMDLALERRVTAPFDFLLDKINPKLIIAHGAEAVEHLKKKALSAHLIEAPHFSRGWSQASARALGQQIRSHILR
jgi:hypothetical protein